MMKRILAFLGCSLMFILCLVFCLPVILLPIATAVPVIVWVPLIAADLALLILGFRLKPPERALTISCLGTLAIGILAIISSQFFARTPLITNAQGEPLAGSIASLEKVNLNGSDQWLSIRGQDIHAPVLLFLAGGPGGSQLATARFALGGLEKHFVVVNWDQPGSGKSFDVAGRTSLTPERYLADAHTLVQLLRQRFDQDKIYVLGESWGSALGIMLVQQYPEDFHAFIGTGQMVAFLENDLMCYDFALRLAQERADTAKLEKLTQQGPPPYYGKGVAWKQAAYLLDTYSYMNSNPAIADNGANTFRDLAAPEYGLYDKLNWFRGVLDTLGVVYPHLWDIDFRTQATKLAVPVYFLIGRHDINAPTILVEEYLEVLEAPHKEIVWFEHSGHTPWVSEADRFVQVIVDTVLAQTQAR